MIKKMVECTHEQKYWSLSLHRSNTYKKKGPRLKAIISNTQPSEETTQKISQKVYAYNRGTKGSDPCLWSSRVSIAPKYTQPWDGASTLHPPYDAKQKCKGESPASSTKHKKTLTRHTHNLSTTTMWLSIGSHSHPKMFLLLSQHIFLIGILRSSSPWGSTALGTERHQIGKRVWD